MRHELSLGYTSEHRGPLCFHSTAFIVVRSLSCIWLFVTPWTAAHQASLSFTVSQSFLKLMSIESVMLSNHVIFYISHLPLPSNFPTIGVFSDESVPHIRWPKYWVSTSAMNIQGWYPFGLNGLQPKGLSRVFSSTTAWKHQFFGIQPS